MVAKIAEAIAIGLTDDELSLLAGINPDTMTEWRKDPEFSEAIKRAGAQRLLMRLERIETGEQGVAGDHLGVRETLSAPEGAHRDELLRQFCS